MDEVAEVVCGRLLCRPGVYTRLDSLCMRDVCIERGDIQGDQQGILRQCRELLELAEEVGGILDVGQ